MEKKNKEKNWKRVKTTTTKKILLLDNEGLLVGGTNLSKHWDREKENWIRNGRRRDRRDELNCK